jgi:hypothetical protein
MTTAETIELLRAAGADRLDPVQFHYADALQRRLTGADASVRTVLEEKLQRALDALRDRLQGEADPPPVDAGDAASLAGVVTRAGSPDGPGELLALLNEHIRESAGDAGAQATRLGAPLQDQAGDGLRSAGRFRESWGRMRAQEDVEQAISRRPGEAGPLNSHNLVVSTLVLMRELSPDYLRRFLATADALLWLEQQKARSTDTG